MKIDQILVDLKRELKHAKNENPSKKIGFMLGSTVSLNPKNEPYRTPARFYDKFIIFGIIVFNQIDAMVVAKTISPYVDQFYVDVEKKLPIDFSPNYEWAKLYNIFFKSEQESPELGNISQAIRPLITDAKIIPYKANDLTVDAVWNFVSKHTGDLSSKKIFILGLGNLGAKLSLKFVESGAAVIVYGINSHKDSLIVNALNYIKNKAVLADISLTESLEFGLLRSEIVILATSAKNIFDIKLAKCASKCKLVIDVGKGNLTNEAIEFFQRKEIPIWRADITDYLPVMLNASNSLINTFNKKFGFRIINELKIISGGWLGQEDDIVVDDYKEPTKIIGICDGLGGFKEKSNNQIKELEAIIFNATL